jgi:D-alanine-D-alanine ligase
VIDVARGAFLAIGGTSYGRVDMRLDARGLPRVIDVNPNPDIHPDAGLCIAAQSVGMDHSILVTQLVAEATVKVADAVQADSKRRSRTARRALGARR